MQFTDRKLCLTDRQKPLRTVRTEFNPSTTIRAKQRNILSVDNEVQFTDHKLCLTDRQKRIRTVRTERTVRSINGPLQCGYIGQHSSRSVKICIRCFFLKKNITYQNMEKWNKLL